MILFFSLTYFTLYDKFCVYPCHYECSFLWLILYCIHVPRLLYPFICQWTSRLLPIQIVLQHNLTHCKATIELIESSSVMANSLRPHGLYSPWACQELDTTEQLSPFTQILYSVTSLSIDYKAFFVLLFL